ncbi:VWA domain-containing protein [Synechococcus sp. UW140]|uniref:vWA domain-containing protein n=1 Tax=Synechococcus sp. UW140 TaxID=368503 RepID=UPI000E0EA197|nr:VWA domain-containing protein [Synechococcus sp. UW140]
MSNSQAPAPSLRFRPLRPAVSADAPGRLDLLISVVPPPAPNTTQKRTPLNLALVIDRSGSMNGAPLSQARKAACFLARELTPADRLAIVVFDHDADVLVPSMPVKNPEVFVRAINSIEARGMTDLQLGWVTGARQVAEQLNPQVMNRVLLLSDGHTNHGTTEAEVIAQQVAGLSSRGVSTSAFGLGDGFDEDLMGAIASGGDGTLAFIDNPDQLADLYANELNGLTNTAAKRISLGLRTVQGAELIDALNDLPQTAYGNWQLPNLQFGHELHVAVRLQLPPWKANNEIATLRLAWEEPGDEQRHSVRVPLTLPVLPAEELAAMDVDPLVAEQFALLQANRDRQRAIDALDADDLQTADQCLMAIDHSLASMPTSDAIVAERVALTQRRAMLKSDRNKSRKHLRREALRSSVHVWDDTQATGD